MTQSPPLPRQREMSGEVDGQPRCVMCEHRLTDHDAIGLRYCQATQAQALSRNCICRDV
jgi:hypothetical protein